MRTTEQRLGEQAQVLFALSKAGQALADTMIATLLLLTQRLECELGRANEPPEGAITFRWEPWGSAPVHLDTDLADMCYRRDIRLNGEAYAITEAGRKRLASMLDFVPARRRETIEKVCRDYAEADHQRLLDWHHNLPCVALGKSGWINWCWSCSSPCYEESAHVRDFAKFCAKATKAGA